MPVEIKHAEFVQGARSLRQLPRHDLPEIALFGRSNVGKSSLINRLLGRHKLARVGRTPGVTRELNFFAVSLKSSFGGPEEIMLVDVPGFGYAALGKDERENLLRLALGFVESGPNLAGVCLLNDIRRVPGEEELAVRECAFAAERHLLIALTKSDKLPKGQRQTQRRKVASAYGLEEDDVVLTGDKLPTEELWERLLLPLGG